MTERTAKAAWSALDREPGLLQEVEELREREVALIQELKSQKDAYSIELGNLRDALRALQVIKKNLTEKLHQATSEKLSKEGECQRLIGINKKLREQITKAETRIETLKQRVESLKQRGFWDYLTGSNK